MRARDWILTAIGGLTGCAAAALGVFYVASFGGTGHGATAHAFGGPFTLVDDTGATVTESTLAGKPYAMCGDGVGKLLAEAGAGAVAGAAVGGVAGALVGAVIVDGWAAWKAWGI